MKKASEVGTVPGTTGREIRHVEVLIKRQRRSMSFEVFARKHPIRAAKRFAKEMGFGGLDFDWPNAIVKVGPIPETSGLELEPFEEEIFRQLLAGEIKTEMVVGPGVDRRAEFREREKQRGW
jgi:hypothetical protein